MILSSDIESQIPHTCFPYFSFTRAGNINETTAATTIFQSWVKNINIITAEEIKEVVIIVTDSIIWDIFQLL